MDLIQVVIQGPLWLRWYGPVEGNWRSRSTVQLEIDYIMNFEIKINFKTIKNEQ
jgi:hypothetical protein